MAEDAIPRRGFLKGAGAAGAAAATVLGGRSQPAQAQAPAAEAATETTASEAYLTLTAIEAAFLSAAYDTFIPADKLRGQPLSAKLGRQQPVLMGGATFPQNPGHNPTGTIGALAYWSAAAITSQYLKSPGPLVRA